MSRWREEGEAGIIADGTYLAINREWASRSEVVASAGYLHNRGVAKPV